MGNDIRKIIPADLAILSNAAVIAVNQDPSGSSAARRWISPSNTLSTTPTTQMWSGSLVSTTGGTYSDMVVLLVNGHDSPQVLNATLADIFVDNGLAGTAPQAQMSWEVRDLWANRMSDSLAAEIISSSSAAGNYTTGYNATTVGGDERYNATKTSYAEGLKAMDPRLLGNVTTTVSAGGMVTATVDAHGAAMFRLRAVGASMRKRDEL